MNEHVNSHVNIGDRQPAIGPEPGAGMSTEQQMQRSLFGEILD